MLVLAESTSTEFQTGVEQFVGLGVLCGRLLAELIQPLLLIHFADHPAQSKGCLGLMWICFLR